MAGDGISGYRKAKSTARKRHTVRVKAEKRLADFGKQIGWDASALIAYRYDSAIVFNSKRERYLIFFTSVAARIGYDMQNRMAKRLFIRFYDNRLFRK